MAILENPLRYHHGTMNVGIVDLSLGTLQPWKWTCKPQNHPIERTKSRFQPNLHDFGVATVKKFMTGVNQPNPLTRHDAHLAVKAPKAPATEDDMALGEEFSTWSKCGWWKEHFFGFQICIYFQICIKYVISLNVYVLWCILTKYIVYMCFLHYLHSCTAQRSYIHHKN